MDIKTEKEMLSILDNYVNMINKNIKNYPSKKLMVKFHRYLGYIIDNDMNVEMPQDVGDVENYMFFIYAVFGNNTPSAFIGSFEDEVASFEKFKKDFYKKAKFETFIFDYFMNDIAEQFSSSKEKKGLDIIRRDLYEEYDHIEGAINHYFEIFENLAKEITNEKDEEINTLLEINGFSYTIEEIRSVQNILLKYFEFVYKHCFYN